MSTTSSCTCSSSVHSRSSFEDGSSWSDSLTCSDLTTQQSQVDLTLWDFEHQFDPVDGSLYFLKLDIEQIPSYTHPDFRRNESPNPGHSRWSSWVAKREKKKKSTKVTAHDSTGGDEDTSRPRSKPPREKLLENLISSRNAILDLFKSTPCKIVLPAVGNEFVVIYIKSESIKNENENGCYQFPKNESEIGKSFQKLKGMFITLNQVVCDTVHEMPIDSTIEVRDTIETSQKYSISYEMFGGGLLVVAVEESIQESVITASEIKDIVKVMVNLLFNSAEDCFGMEGNETKLDRLLTSLHRTLFKESMELHLRPSSIEKLITSDDELDLSISEVLTEFEAMDWIEEINCENRDDVIASCLNFIVIGSCLLRNGFMVSSHFDQQVGYQVNTYLLSNGVLETSKEWDCKILFFHQIFLKSDDTRMNTDKYWLIVLGIGHTIFSAVFQIPFTNWSIDIAVQSIMLKESIKFVQSNLINSGLMDDIDRIVFNRDSKFFSSFVQLIERRRESSSSFLGAKSRSFRNLLSSNFSKSSFLSPDTISNRAHSTPSLIQSNMLTPKTNTATTVSTESNSSSLNHNFLRPEQNSHVAHQKFSLFLKVDPSNRTIVSPITYSNRCFDDDLFTDLIRTFRKTCIELELSCHCSSNTIESGIMMVVAKESLVMYVSREEIGSEILYCASSEITKQATNHYNFDNVFL